MRLTIDRARASGRVQAPGFPATEPAAHVTTAVYPDVDQQAGRRSASRQHPPPVQVPQSAALGQVVQVAAGYTGGGGAAAAPPPQDNDEPDSPLRGVVRSAPAQQVAAGAAAAGAAAAAEAWLAATAGGGGGAAAGPDVTLQPSGAAAVDGGGDASEAETPNARASANSPFRNAPVPVVISPSKPDEGGVVYRDPRDTIESHRSHGSRGSPEEVGQGGGGGSRGGSGGGGGQLQVEVEVPAYASASYRPGDSLQGPLPGGASPRLPGGTQHTAPQHPSGRSSAAGHPDLVRQAGRPPSQSYGGGYQQPQPPTAAAVASASTAQGQWESEAPLEGDPAYLAYANLMAKGEFGQVPRPDFPPGPQRASATSAAAVAAASAAVRGSVSGTFGRAGLGSRSEVPAPAPSSPAAGAAAMGAAGPAARTSAPSAVRSSAPSMAYVAGSAAWRSSRPGQLTDAERAARRSRSDLWTARASLAADARTLRAAARLLRSENRRLGGEAAALATSMEGLADGSLSPEFVRLHAEAVTRRLGFAEEVAPLLAGGLGVADRMREVLPPGTRTDVAAAAAAAANAAAAVAAAAQAATAPAATPAQPATSQAQHGPATHPVDVAADTAYAYPAEENDQVVYGADVDPAEYDFGHARAEEYRFRRYNASMAVTALAVAAAAESLVRGATATGPQAAERPGGETAAEEAGGEEAEEEDDQRDGKAEREEAAEEEEREARREAFRQRQLRSLMDLLGARAAGFDLHPRPPAPEPPQPFYEYRPPEQPQPPRTPREAAERAAAAAAAAAAAGARPAVVRAAAILAGTGGRKMDREELGPDPGVSAVERLLAPPESSLLALLYMACRQPVPAPEELMAALEAGGGGNDPQDAAAAAAEGDPRVLPASHISGLPPTGDLFMDRTSPARAPYGQTYRHVASWSVRDSHLVLERQAIEMQLAGRERVPRAYDEADRMLREPLNLDEPGLEERADELREQMQRDAYEERVAQEAERTREEEGYREEGEEETFREEEDDPEEEYS
ncbi:hypothetical protein GPECTOR_1g33 [Gonium pectorale]|uniref:Uncharacterized protein n=1 Tax=Gonium pectorale TaxID=33097 RepID=A0A150H307_GONPE|nr:hypothetical protein GPECTOR_1g33 [Gonium pectorale]|eukprot:KXZ56372.1 hypothetical protein GPECTOR_1g33 [Gonium pectorale]